MSCTAVLLLFVLAYRLPASRARAAHEAMIGAQLQAQLNQPMSSIHDAPLVAFMQQQQQHYENHQQEQQQMFQQQPEESFVEVDAEQDPAAEAEAAALDPGKHNNCNTKDNDKNVHFESHHLPTSRR